MSIHELRPKTPLRVDIEGLTLCAIARFNNVLSFMEIIRHTTGDEESEVSWQPVGKKKSKIFIIPKQRPVFANDSKYGGFVFVRVIDKQSRRGRWLFMQAGCGGREGFLLPWRTFSPKKKLPKPKDTLPEAA